MNYRGGATFTCDPPWAERLQAFIARELDEAGTLRAQRIAGGQSNPTWFIDQGERRLVLRMQPSGTLLPSAHAVDREFRIMRALETTEVPVPRVLCFSEDRSVVGTPFYLMERVDGRVFHSSALEGVSPAERRAMYASAAQTLGRLHAVEWERLGLADFGKHGDYFERQIRRWSRQWEGSRVREIPAIDRLIAELPNHIPPDGETAISHGDYRFGNLMFDSRSPNIVAVLDWELSTLGDPLADLGFFCTVYHATSAEYGGIADLDAAALGIPSQEEVVAKYVQAAGCKRKLEPFHIAFAFFRFAVIFAGIEARARQGNAVDAEAARFGVLTESFAERACALMHI